MDKYLSQDIFANYLKEKCNWWNSVEIISGATSFCTLQQYYRNILSNLVLGFQTLNDYKQPFPLLSKSKSTCLQPQAFYISNIKMRNKCDSCHEM